MNFPLKSFQLCGTKNYCSAKKYPSVSKSSLGTYMYLDFGLLGWALIQGWARLDFNNF